MSAFMAVFESFFIADYFSRQWHAVVSRRCDEVIVQNQLIVGDTETRPPAPVLHTPFLRFPPINLQRGIAEMFDL